MASVQGVYVMSGCCGNGRFIISHNVCKNIIMWKVIKMFVTWHVTISDILHYCTTL